MSVYFATCRAVNAVKIGSSLEPWGRLTDLQTSCPLLITLEAVVPGGCEEEFTYHRRFEDDRIRGEWFTINEMIELIIRLNPASAPPDKAVAKETRRVRVLERRELRRGMQAEQKRRDNSPWAARERQLGRQMKSQYEAAMAEMRAAKGDG